MKNHTSETDGISNDEIRKRYTELLDFVENGSVGLHQVGRDGTILWANRAELELLGYSAGEYIGRPISDFHVDAPVIEDMLKRLTAGETLHSYEARLRCKDGSVRTVLISSNVYRKDGKFIHTRCFTRDITEKRKVEAELSYSRHLLAKITEAMPEVVYVYDLRSRSNTYINREMLQTLGYSPEQVFAMGSRVMETLVHPEDLGRISEDYKRFERLADGEVDYQEYRIRHADGTFRWMGNRCAVFARSSDGAVTQILGIGRDITKEKAVGAALQRSEKELRLILDDAPLGVYLVDQDMRIQHINPTARPVFGDMAGLLGADFTQVLQKVWPAPAANQILERFKHTLATGEPFIVREFSEERADRGNREYYDWEIHRVTLPGDRRGVVCYFKDVSEQVMAKRAVIDSEARLRALLANLPDVISRFDSDFRFLYISPACAKLTGRPPEHFIGKTHAEAGVPAALASELESELRRIFVEGREVNIRFDLPRPDGTRRLVGRGLPERDENGRVVSALTILRDVTAQSLAEEEARRAESQFHTLADTIPNLAWMANADGGIFWFNRRWYEYTGTKPKDVKGWGWTSVHHPDELPKVLQKWKASIESGIDFYMTFQLKGGDGVFRPFLTRIIPVHDENGRIVRWFGTSTDVTDQLESEKKLRRQAQELARSNKELEQFAYVASHDLQEPLRKITSYLDLLHREAGDYLSAKAKGYMGPILNGVERMRDLINGLLSYSRVSAVTAEVAEVNLQEEVTRAAELIQADEASRIDIGALPTVRGNALQLRQVFQNLLSNALKFRSGAPPVVSVSAERQDDFWLFRVADNGIGIDPDYQNKLFIIFQRLHTQQKYPGTGIGLAICKKIVESHGGRIWFESRPGAGTTFMFTLPAG